MRAEPIAFVSFPL